MDILFVAPYVPNLIRVRPFNIIRTLSNRGHRVTVLTLWTNDRERAQIEPLKQICHDVQALSMPIWQSLLNSALAVPSRQPLQSVFSWKPQLVSHLNGSLPYDVVHVEHLRGSRYGLYFKTHTGLPVVWDSVDCISHLFRQASAKSQSLLGRIRSRFELARTSEYESWLLDKFEHVVVTSPTDKEALLKLKDNGLQAAPISVVGNGVDIEHFYPDPAVPRDPMTLVVSGKMSYHANVSMTLYLIQNIMPHVWAQRPEAKVMVVGKDPTREIQMLAAHPNVVVTGMVEALPPYLRRATIAVAPLTYGAGIQNKVLEAMACATPVITTPQAVSALEVVSGRDLLVAETAEELARAIVTLLDDSDKQKTLGKNGRSYIETHHHWPHVAAKFEKIYQKTIEVSQNHTVYS